VHIGDALSATIGSRMFDTVRFLQENFNSPDGVVGLLGAYKQDVPPRDTVRKWFSRGNVPSEWFPLLCAILELDHGSPISLAKYLGSASDGKK